MTLGIIDLGTNSAHLVIGVLGLNGRFHPIVKERELTRLGDGAMVKGRLTVKSMRRAMDVLARYAAMMKRVGVDHVEAVATSAVRDASNGQAFVRRVRAQLGLPLKIISGLEEARLIYLGVLHSNRFRGGSVIVTIGGGSAQVIHGSGARLLYKTSLPLGGARLAQRFIQHDPPRSDEVLALDETVRRAWGPVARALRRHRWRRALGSSATISQLMEAAHLLTHGRPVKKHRLSITRGALRQLVRWLAASTARERMRLPGLDPRREDLALPTAVALLAWMDACGIPRIRHASGSLREGLVVEYLIRHHRHRHRWIEASLTELFGNGAWGSP